MSSRGKKDCQNCNTEIAARTLLCSCGYHFPSGEIRKDLLEKKDTPKEVKIYTEPGAGRKTCSNCKVIISARIKICPKCGFDFTTIKKIKVTRQEEKNKDLVIEEIVPEKKSYTEKVLLKEVNQSKSKHVALNVEYLTSQQHAERILNYGVKRAKMLLNLHKWCHTWSHVDWKLVEERI